MVLADKYEQYLKSEWWKKIRTEKLYEATHKCAVCASLKNLNVHHNMYDRLGHEELSDLVVLCEDCHELFHKRMESRQRQQKWQEIREELDAMKSDNASDSTKAELCRQLWDQPEKLATALMELRKRRKSVLEET